MFESLGGKVLAGMLSLSVFIFGNYEGNDASLGAFSAQLNNKTLYVKTQLQNAFDHDFDKMFQTGKVITVWFKVDVVKDKKVLHSSTFRHAVQYDPLANNFTVFREEMNEKRVFTSEADMIKSLSQVECFLPVNPNWGVVDMKLTSWMKKIKFEEYKRDIDLMMLWKFKKPSLEKRIRLGSNEN